jgi:two-component system, chemotaxis family, chemotaxis protein CheY
MALQSTSYDFSRISCLIIDDSLHVINLLKSILNKFKLGSINYTSNAAEGMEIFLEKKNIDIIFCNWEMAPMSGIDFLQQIRSSDQKVNPYIPIIIISANSEYANIMKAKNAGANAFLAKPFSPLTIAKYLKYIIEKPKNFVKTKTYFGPDRRVQEVEFFGDNKRGNE